MRRFLDAAMFFGVVGAILWVTWKTGGFTPHYFLVLGLVIAVATVTAVWRELTR